MSIQVNDFRWEPGKNDAKYIELLESSRDEWQKIAQKAITKLKTLSKAQEPCEDAVSKQAVISALEGEYSDWNDDYNIQITHCIKAVQSLPSVQPVPVARVMTYDELATFDGAFLIESSAISQLDWVFFFDTDTKSDAIWVEGFDGERYVVYREDYGTYTRCWTSRPTDEQREATPWN